MHSALVICLPAKICNPQINTCNAFANMCRAASSTCTFPAEAEKGDTVPSCSSSHIVNKYPKPAGFYANGHQQTVKKTHTQKNTNHLRVTIQRPSLAHLYNSNPVFSLGLNGSVFTNLVLAAILQNINIVD